MKHERSQHTQGILVVLVLVNVCIDVESLCTATCKNLWMTALPHDIVYGLELSMPISLQEGMLNGYLLCHLTWWHWVIYYICPEWGSRLWFDDQVSRLHYAGAGGFQAREP
jgi:hypothetical protein